MPWKTINQIIGLAFINQAFRQQLQQDPQAALEVQGVTLTPEELEVFKAFAQFCQCLLKRVRSIESKFFWRTRCFGNPKSLVHF